MYSNKNENKQGYLNVCETLRNTPFYYKRSLFLSVGDGF